MKSHLKIHPIPYGTDEWYDFRKNGIGGSEVSTVLGLNKFDTVMRLFHEKVGSIEPRRIDNNAMFWGRELEDKIADIWEFYDGTDYGYIDNRKEGKVIRNCRKVNGYVVNPKYPWLYASVDRVMNIKGGVNLITGEALTEEGVLECKTASSFTTASWQDGLPIYHLTQVQQYMLVLETDYSEIAILEDGRKFIVEKIARDDALCEKIASITKMFWENRILPARAAYKKQRELELQGKFDLAEKHEAIVQRHEPDPDNTEAYREFMEERFLKEQESVEGNFEQYSQARKYTFFTRFKDRIESERDLLKNTLIRDMEAVGAEMIDFGEEGKVTWLESGKRKNRTFRINMKKKPREERLDEEIIKINTEYK